MERIIDKNSTEQFRADYQRYGIAVTFTRVIPDYRDGLKPVQRRLLWGMYNDTKAIRSTVKSARIIGDVMGKYHAHGDASIYSTMKPMTNWFENYMPTIEGQGSFGNFQGDDASADRYTEARLNKFSIDCIFDELRLSDKCVDWSPNFDNTMIEPNFLPVKVPLLLINGTFGIGLGKKTEIPSHNINEVIDATLALIHNPNADIVLVPDHCKRCEIVNTDFKNICRTGYGYYKVRGVVDIEDYKGHTALVIKGTPNLVFLNSITEKIEDLIEKKKIVQIQSMYDESTEFDMRYVIVLRPGADPNYVRDVIYKNTELERNDRVNFEVLDGLNPLRMSYKSYLLSFIDHRKLTKFRLYTNRLQYVKTKLHEKEMYIALLKNKDINEIIKYVENRKDEDDITMIEYLIKRYKMTDLQAKFILSSNIRHLSKGHLSRLEYEAGELQKEFNHCMTMVNSDELILKEIIEELENIKALYGKKRNCKIVRDSNEVVIPQGIMTIAVTEKNMIKKVPAGTNIGNFRGDKVKTLIQADNTDSLLIFDNMGKVFKLLIDKIPFVDHKSNGIDIRFLVKNLTADIITVIPEGLMKLGGNKDNVERSYIACITKNGLIKKMDDSDFLNVPPSGILYTRLDNDDYVVSVRLCNDNVNFIAFSDRRIMSIPANMIPTIKRNSKGNKTFKNGGVDGFVELDSGNNSHIVIITKNNKVNKIPIIALPDLAKPKKMISVIKLNKDDSIQNIILCNEADSIGVSTVNENITIPVKDIPSGSSISTGAKVFSTRGSKIIQSSKL